MISNRCFEPLSLNHTLTATLESVWKYYFLVFVFQKRSMYICIHFVNKHPHS